MGYKSLVVSSVNKAFSLVKDLAINVTLSKSTVTGFDFASNSAVVTNAPAIIVKAILVTKARKPTDEQSATVSNSLLMKSIDIPDPTIYDRITMEDGSMWSLVMPYANDGYTITVNIKREGT